MTEVLSVLMTVLFEIQKTQALLRHNCKTGYEQFRDEWIDGSRLCQLLNVSPRTLQSLRDNQSLPFSRLRSKLYYRIDDVARILETNYDFKPLKGERYECR
jgi:hypothetical protein